jgi:hypothetical protein
MAKLRVKKHLSVSGDINKEACSLRYSNPYGNFEPRIETLYSANSYFISKGILSNKRE